MWKYYSIVDIIIEAFYLISTENGRNIRLSISLKDLYQKLQL
jgi:hypothetical protein